MPGYVIAVFIDGAQEFTLFCEYSVWVWCRRLMVGESLPQAMFPDCQDVKLARYS